LIVDDCLESWRQLADGAVDSNNKQTATRERTSSPIGTVKESCAEGFLGLTANAGAMWKAASSFLTLCLHTIRLWWALRCDGSAKQLLQQLTL
jgi:hypothetical protein